MNSRPAVPIMSSTRGFTLIEMLVVLIVISLLFGLAFSMPSSDQREAHVRGAAEELAAVMRETRARAIRKKTPYGVVFNIANAPGSSGRILNNRGGGHWYRVIGPHDTLLGENGAAINEASYHPLPFINMSRSSLNGLNCWWNPPPIEHYLSLVSRSWVDEPHLLAKGKVRFLALTDQDNGDNASPAQGGYYTATYPRPWFGWWDQATGLLHPWGGYDPALKGASQKFWGYDPRYHNQVFVNGRIASISGFYYEGWDGQVTGCVNPIDRKVLQDDVTNPAGEVGVYDAADIAAAKRYTVYSAGESRPLINADWLDYVIVFRPDGTVTDDWFRLRQGYGQLNKRNGVNGDPYVPAFPTYDYNDAGLADRCNLNAYARNWDDYTTSYLNISNAQREATSFVDRTGYYWITLAPDAPNDSQVFSSAEQAVRSLTPMYRVGVSPEGQVKVIRVHNTYKGPLTFDAAITGIDWQDKNKIWGRTGATWSLATPIIQPNYVNHELRNADGSPRGLPITDTVLPEMLRDRKWWWKYP
jgi:prepilin-type N-terminal cleavage/methylation domain-containing protein